MKIIAADQGTTGTKSFLLDGSGHFEPVASFEHRQIYPKPGWVEHDAEELLSHLVSAIEACGKADGLGIANQGETVVAWDAATGKPICNAIVWQDNRTMEVTERLKAEGAEALTQKKAGLPLDPYFSASKLRWFLDHVEEARSLRKSGRLRLGTSDAFFLDRLSGNFATDVTTASRTSLMSLEICDWDPELCALFGVPIECLPQISPTAGLFGSMGAIPVSASLVDQQAALFGHGCAKPGDTKITFGTGAFALSVAGASRVDGSRFGILPTLAWKVKQAPAEFALEGGVYNAASALNWARDIGLFNDFAEIESFSAEPAIARGLAFVPALSGLACPHWDRSAAGLWLGLGLETTRADMVQSILEGVALRAAEVIGAMAELLPLSSSISVDGGMARNAYFLQFLSDVLERKLIVPSTTDLTGLGAARMAMKGLGVTELPPLPPPLRSVEPRRADVSALRDRFADAVKRSRAWRQA